MQSDSMDDSGWYHETHGNSSANQSSQRGKKEDAEKIAVQWLAKRFELYLVSFILQTLG